MDAESSAKIQAALESARQLADLRKNNKHIFFSPIEKQKRICNSRKKIIVVFGGNRVGKTKISSFILACHLTGVYPDWWTGHRFSRPVEIGIIGKTNRAVRDVMQVALLGPSMEPGTGMIPKDALAKAPTKQQGVPDLVDTIFVKHVSGGISTAKLFSCQQGPEVIMGQNWDLAAFDEEPTQEMYDQARMRIVSRNGIMLLTFTPEDGLTSLCDYLLRLPEDMCERVFITWDDAAVFMPAEERERQAREMPEWQKEFRMYGRPSVGERGRVFKYSRDMFVIDPIEPEKTWRRVAGLDVGYGHATCAIDLYIDDRTTEPTYYVVNEYFSREELPDTHAAKLRGWGDVDFYIDPSSRRRAPTDGQNLFDMYKNRGLNIVLANNDVDASILFINQLLANKQLFICSNCTTLIEQMGLYRRVIDKKTNRSTILKRDDDAIDPFRYALMAADNARVPNVIKPKHVEQITQKVKFNEWRPADPRYGY